MNLVTVNNVIYKIACVCMALFLIILVVGELVMHLYLRSALGFALAVVILFRIRKSASIKSWIITIIIFAIAVAIMDLYVTESKGNIAYINGSISAINI
jgi:thiol:disulfide interchange protein